MKHLCQNPLFRLISLFALLLSSGQTFAQVSEKSEMLYRRGLAAYKAGDFSSAQSFFEQTLAENYYPDAAVYLTYIRKETGDFEGALESLQAYLDNTGDNDPNLQSYVSLKLFLEARIAAENNKPSQAISYLAITLAVLALVVSIISLRKRTPDNSQQGSIP